jgi:hypothetical protein
MFINNVDFFDLNHGDLPSHCIIKNLYDILNACIDTFVPLHCCKLSDKSCSAKYQNSVRRKLRKKARHSEYTTFFVLQNHLHRTEGQRSNANCSLLIPSSFPTKIIWLAMKIQELFTDMLTINSLLNISQAHCCVATAPSRVTPVRWSNYFSARLYKIIHLTTVSCLNWIVMNGLNAILVTYIHYRLGSTGY